MGFNKYKLMVQAHLPNINIESLRANLSDESLVATVNDGTGIIIEATKKNGHKAEANVAPPPDQNNPNW